MAHRDFQVINKEQALNHLFKREKYDVLMKLWPKVILLLQKGSEKVTFCIGKEQRSYPANLIKPFSNIEVNTVRISDTKYNIKEVETLMGILINIPTFVCSGIFTNYKDWNSISSLVNVIELAELFGMVEIKAFLQSIPNLMTEYNKNIFEVEVKRRRAKTEEEYTITSDSKENRSKQQIPEKRGRSKSRSRRKSITEIVRRSLSRGRKNNDD